MTIEIVIKNKLRFLNTGVITPNNVGRRNWESNVEYHFVSAGHNMTSIKSIKKLEKEDIICAYISTQGFVGIGEVIKPAIPVRDFLFKNKTLENLPSINMDSMNGLFANAGDKNLQEYLIEVNWIKTVSQKDAFSVQGLGFHIHPGVQCELKKNNQRQESLLNFIEKNFGVTFKF